MKKILFPVIIVLLYSVNLSLPLSAGQLTYKDPGGAYSFNYPDDFEQRTGASSDTAQITNLEKRMVFSIVKASGGNFTIKDIQQLFTQYPEIEEMSLSKIKSQGFTVGARTSSTCKGTPSVTYMLCKTQDNILMTGSLILFFYGEDLYSIMTAGLKENYAHDAAIFNSIINSLRFR